MKNERKEKNDEVEQINYQFKTLSSTLSKAIEQNRILMVS
jgi:hypothetical protein